VQPGILQRDAHLAGDGHQQVEVLLLERPRRSRVSTWMTPVGRRSRFRNGTHISVRIALSVTLRLWRNRPSIAASLL
jgi:hypothetical protein